LGIRTRRDSPKITAPRRTRLLHFSEWSS